MTQPQALVFLIIAATMGMFLWGRLRHDMVALASLLAAVAAGVVDPAAAFAGFSQPAVMTVACVLVLSRALQVTGAVDVLAAKVLPKGRGVAASLAALLGLGAFLSAFMNNVGALALLMPVAIRLAGQIGLTPGQVLMPLSFATLFGGMTTLIGTPPNLIVAGLREEAGLGPWQMFSFTPVGVAVAGVGVAALVLGVWRLVPARQALGEDFAVGAYLTEVSVPPKAALVGRTLHEAEEAFSASGAQIVGLVRNGVHLTAPRGSRVIAPDDILVVEAELAALNDSLATLGLELLEKDHEGAPRESRDIQIREYVVRPDSALVWRTPVDLGLRSRFGLNLLAVSRSGRRRTSRLRETRFESGDLLLVQGPAEALAAFTTEAGVVPLAERDVSIPDRGKAALAAGIMAVVIALAAFGIVPTAISFAGGVLATVVLGTLPIRQLYESIDWPVIVLLGALIPVAGAMETTGAAALVARTLVERFADGAPLLALGIVLVVTMTLSDLMNNAATAAVMTPIALGIAAALGASPDAFLMAVAIGASCAFLTPIGHQNNTLILGPGGFGFGDYWRAGVVMEGIVLVVSLIALPLVFPF